MAESSRARVWAALAATLLLAFLCLTRTRSAAVAMVVEAVVLVAWWGRRRRWLWVLTGVAAAVLALAVALQWRGASASGAARLSVEGRAAIWRNTLVMIREHPLLGVGLGAHSVMYPAYHRRAVVDPLFSPRTHLDFAHNDYLQLTAEMGLVGVALLGALGAAFVRVIREARSGGGEAALASAAIASTAGLLADALFSFPAYRALPPWLLALDAAVLAVLARGSAPARRFLIVPRGRRQLLAGVAAVACVALGVAHSRWLRADGHFEAARRAEAKGLAGAMGAEAAEAVALDRARADGWFSLGTAALLAGEPAPAVRALQEAAAREPLNPNTLANLGLARAQSGDRAGAADAFRRALAISPGEKEVSAQLARLLPEGGDPGAQYRRGLAALRADRLVEAEEALRSAITLDPGGAGAHKALGVVLLQGGRRDEAARHFQDALRLDASITDRAMMERVIAEAQGR
jgi:Flp pilus assembly protein TadD